MREYVLLDSSLLGHACQRRGMVLADQCRLWIDGLMARGVEVVVPEIADFEVRRELTRTNALGGMPSPSSAAHHFPPLSLPGRMCKL